MTVVKGLPYNKLRNECNLSIFDFENTSELDSFKEIIGQDRAVKAMEFGLKIKIKGYNIYMAGSSGTGKTSYAFEYIQKIAKEMKIPNDWCYVYNFEKPSHPKAINLPSGIGKIFQKDMDEFIKILNLEISKAFDGEDYEKEKSEIVKDYQSKRDDLVEKLNKDAEKQGFKVKSTNAGIFFLPVIEGKTLSEEEYTELDDEIKKDINKRSDLLQEETIQIIRKIKNIEKEAKEKVSEWENKIALFAVGMHINDLKEKYKDFENISEYLEAVQKNILENLDDFREEDSQDEQQMVLPWVRKNEDLPTDKYKVNVLVDNSKLKGAPVIIDYNPNYYNLLGKLEYENEFGTMSTDFTMIKGGLLHQANGGFIILQIKDLLSNLQSWEALKRVIKTKEINIENIKDQMGLVTVSTLKPEAIPIDVKVILVGSSYIYQYLYENDGDFQKLFKIKADFDAEMDRTNENVKKLAKFISSFCRRENTPHFDKSGVAQVIDYSTRLVEDQSKLSTKFNEIVDLLSEACTWAEIEGCKFVSEKHVKTAIMEKKYRSDKYDKKLLELLEDGTILIDTEGLVVGQINALTILDMGDYAFGKPSRITATTYMGKRGIVNIEREVEMSGTSHTKGVLILSGYIGQKYAQELPLSLSASLCFEQLYSGVDGDSASSAELYALLSSLSELPIKQGIAVTGSVNQRGEIQPIGGATNKIEGFFELCKYRGLNGEQGVIIPHQNVKNLVLNDEVVDAVKNGQFNIYPVKTIDEGIELLTGVEAGIKNEDGDYPKNSVNYLIYEKLKRFARTVACFGKDQ